MCLNITLAIIHKNDRLKLKTSLVGTKDKKIEHYNKQVHIDTKAYKNT